MLANQAHQGGWDEISLAAGLVLGMLGVSRLRRRPATTQRKQPDDVCAYCGEALERDAARRPSCGFHTGSAKE